MLSNAEEFREFRDFIRHEIEEVTGTGDINKGLNRYGMLMEWEEEKDRCN